MTRGDALASPRRGNPSCRRSPPYFNQTIINVASTAYGGVYIPQHKNVNQVHGRKLQCAAGPTTTKKSTYHLQNGRSTDASAQEKGRQPHARSRVAISTWATNRHRPAVAASGRHQRNKLPATLPMREPQLRNAGPLACCMIDSLPSVTSRRDSSGYSVPPAFYLVLNIGENSPKNIHFHCINSDPAE